MAKVENFDSLISSIQEAFLSVNRMAEQQHLESLKTYLEEDGSPKTLNVKYPCFNEAGEADYRDVEVPALCLVPVSSLKLSEVSVGFKVKLSARISLSGEEGLCAARGRETEKRRDRRKVGFIPEFRQKTDGGYADITLKFHAEEAPEGVLRIRDEMIKILP